MSKRTSTSCGTTTSVSLARLFRVRQTATNAEGELLRCVRHDALMSVHSIRSRYATECRRFGRWNQITAALLHDDDLIVDGSTRLIRRLIHYQQVLAANDLPLPYHSPVFDDDRVKLISEQL